MQPRAKIIKSFCFISKRGKLNPQVYWLRIKNRSKLTWCICRIFIVQKLWTTFTPRSASFRYNKKYSSLKWTIILLQLHIKNRVVTPSRLLTFFFLSLLPHYPCFLGFLYKLRNEKVWNWKKPRTFCILLQCDASRFVPERDCYWDRWSKVFRQTLHRKLRADLRQW